MQFRDRNQKSSKDEEKFGYIRKNAQNALKREDCGKMRVYIFSYKNTLLKYTINRKRSQKK